MDVLDHHGDGPREGKGREERAPRGVELITNLAWPRVGEGHLGIFEPHRVREGGRRAGGVGRDLLGQEVATGLPDLLDGELRWIRVEDPRVTLQDLGERPVRDAVAIGQAPATQDERGRLPRLGPREELAGEPRLPDARVTVERYEMRPTFSDHPLVHAPQHLELGVAPHHGRGETGDPPRSEARLLDQSEGPYPIAFALQLVEPSIVEREAPDCVGGPL